MPKRMDEESHPMDEPLAATAPTETSSKKNRDYMSQTLAVFMSATTFCYVAIDLAGVNVPRYYPLLRDYSTVPIADQISMGFYGRVAVALAAGIILTVLHSIFLPLFRRLGLIRHPFGYGLMVTTVWFSAVVIILEEWHNWGIVKQKLDTGGLFNTEFGLFMMGALVLVIGILLTAGALRRAVILSSDKKAN